MILVELDLYGWHQRDHKVHGSGKSVVRSGADNPIILQEYGNYRELPFVPRLICLTFCHRIKTVQTS